MDDIKELKQRVDDADAAVDAARAGLAAANLALGQALRQCRIRLAVSQIEMGRRLSSCASEISTLERGFKHITDVRLTRYLAALGNPGT